MSLKEKDKEISRLRQELKLKDSSSANQSENNQLGSAQVEELQMDILNLIEDRTTCSRANTSDQIEMEISKAIQKVCPTLSNKASDVTESNDDVIEANHETCSNNSTAENEERETSSNHETDLDETTNEEMTADMEANELIKDKSIPNSSDVRANSDNVAMVTEESRSHKDEDAIITNGQTSGATTLLQSHSEQTQKNIIDTILLCEDSDSDDGEDIEILSRVLLADIQLKKELIDSEETCHEVTNKESYQIGVVLEDEYEALEDEYMETYNNETPALGVDLDLVLPNAGAALNEAELGAASIRTNLDTGDFDQDLFSNNPEEFILDNASVQESQQGEHSEAQPGLEKVFHVQELADGEPESAEILRQIDADLLFTTNDNKDDMEVDQALSQEPDEIGESNLVILASVQVDNQENRIAESTETSTLFDQMAVPNDTYSQPATQVEQDVSH